MIPANLSRFFSRTAIIAGFLLALAGCASVPQEQSADPSETNDPLEIPNRFVFAINEAADILVIRPTAEVYHTVVPDPVRTVVKNLLDNMLAPLAIANHLLQGDFEGAQVTTGRFMTNTILGLGGALDVAAEAGLPARAYEDFGQTLGVWGVGEGAYLVLPLLGPSNVRDATALAVDTLVDPVRIGMYTRNAQGLSYSRTAMTGIQTRSLLLKEIDDLRRNSVDFYATARSLRHQQREMLIRSRLGRSETPLFPEFDEDPAPARKP